MVDAIGLMYYGIYKSRKSDSIHIWYEAKRSGGQNITNWIGIVQSLVVAIKIYIIAWNRQLCNQLSPEQFFVLGSA